MHESSIAYNLIHNVLELAKENNLSRVTLIRIHIGRMHHIVPAVLQQHFRLMGKKYPVVAKAKLEIRSQNIQIRCQQCGKESELTEIVFACPHCQSIRVDMIAGTDMHIIDISGHRGNAH